MVLSKETIGILKNFSIIHPSIIIPEGNTIVTAKQSLAIVAKATVEETFPSLISIADLPKFLMLLVSAKQYRNIEFCEKFVLITLEDNSVIKYMYTPPLFLSKTYGFDKNGKTLFPYEIKNIKTSNNEIKFSLSANELEKLLNISNTLNADELYFYTKDNYLWLRNATTDNDTSNEYKKQLVKVDDQNISIKISLENFHIYKCDYIVSIHDNIIKFVSSNNKITYYMIGVL